MNRAILIWLFMCCSFLVKGQDPYYVPINKANGLPSNTVYYIYQDSKGFIWVAHDEGLSRYDGYEFKNYGSDLQNPKAGTDIKEDKFGRIWYSNFDGYLFYVENGVMRPLKQHAALGYLRYAILDDRLLVMQPKGLDIYDLQHIRLIKTVPFKASEIGGIAGGNDFLSVSSMGKLTFFDKEGNSKSQPISVPGHFYPSGEGIAVIERYNERKSFLYFDKRSGFKTIPIGNERYLQGYVYTDDKHWMCTPKGVWAYNKDGTSFNNGKPFYPSKNITGVLVDNEHNYWIATHNEGILFIPDINTRCIQQGFMANNLLTQNGEIFVTTKKSQVYSYNVRSQSLSLVYSDNIEHPIYTIIRMLDKPGYILLNKRLQYLDENFRNVKSYEGAFKDIKQIDNKYCAYASTGNSGLIKVNEQMTSEWDSLYAHSDTLAIPDAVRLMPIGRGRLVEWLPEQKKIFFVTNNGLFVATPRRVDEILDKNKEIIAASIAVLNRNLFAVTMQNKLLQIDERDHVSEMVFKDEKLKLYKVKNVNDELLLVTNSGIRKFDINSRTLGNSYNMAIPGEEVNDIAAMGNSLLIATDKGLFVSEKTEHRVLPPVLYMQSLTANGKQYSITGNNEFSFKENDIEIKYSILSYKSGANYPLHYCINNGEWRLITDKSRTLKLASLSPGSYEVAFRFSTGEVKQVIHFLILKPVWKRWWFVLLAAIVILAGGVSYYRWQTGLLKKKNMLLLEKVELEKSLHSSMLTSIKSQMNPHFFYNALNTIQSYIFSGDKRNASTYLSKFSRLTRIILEMSEKETVSLSEEISALTFYLDLEKARFNDVLDFAINVSPGLDIDNIKLPSMIIQPYVENSIKHGLLHQRGEKWLAISFDVKDNDLCVVIDDNGIGRKRSEELNKIKTDKHRSFSTEANMKRIEILNRGKKNIGVKYIDKENEAGASMGTTLIITIPLVKETDHVN